MQPQTRMTLLFWIMFLSLYVQAMVAVSQTSDSMALQKWQYYFALKDDDVEEFSKIVPEHIPVDWKDPENGMTMLCVAMTLTTTTGNLLPSKCVHYLIENGANVNLGFTSDGELFTPIRLCCRAGKEARQIAEWLIDSGASFVDENMTDRICLRTALANRELFDYYISKGARVELLLPAHPKKSKLETYSSSILEEAFSYSNVSLEMFEHVYQLVPNQLEILNPTGAFFGFPLCETDAQRKNQCDKMQFLIAHGFDTNACFECRIFGSTRMATFPEHLEKWNAQAILEKQNSKKTVK